MVKSNNAFRVLCPFKPEQISGSPFGILQQKLGDPALVKQKIFLVELIFGKF